MSDQEYRNLLVNRAKTLGLSFEPEVINQLLSYHALLVKWNKAYNLTAVRDPIEMINRHLIDSLSILPFVDNYKSIVDVGSGPGLPGIILAICRPDLAVTTIDSNGKKTRFQTQVKIELKLDNVTVINGRVENCHDQLFDAVISRAFASLNDMIDWTHQICKPDGVFLAMKGLFNEEEISQLPEGYDLIASHVLAVPGTQGSRHLMEIGRV